VELMRVRAEELHAELIWRPAEPMPDMVFDPEGIHRAALNVVTNALDAVADREQPGRVEVATQYAVEQRQVRVVVDDNGPGISADQMEHLFSPFVASKKSRGTGLGLPVSQKILREHGGRILVENKADGGCRFSLELPAALPQPDSETIAGGIRVQDTATEDGPGTQLG
jgi:two-component system, NtrC family, sensor kinase